MSLDLIARMQAMPKTRRVVTVFADGTERHHDVATQGQAENYAGREQNKVGRVLINRETGAEVRVVEVKIEVLK